MIYVPKLKPLLHNKDDIFTEIHYDNSFTRVDDVKCDGEHIHDFYEIYINISGDVSFLVEDTLYSIKRGDMIITAPNEIHRCIYHSSCVHEHFCIWIKELPFTAYALKDEFAKSNLVVLSDDEKERLIEACYSFYKSANGDDTLKFRSAKCFFEILDIICTKRQDTTEAQSLPSSFSEARVR